jgi:hypothetical protein
MSQSVYYHYIDQTHLNTPTPPTQGNTMTNTTNKSIRAAIIYGAVVFVAGMIAPIAIIVADIVT